MPVLIDADLKHRFPDLKVLLGEIHGVSVEKEDEGLQGFKDRVVEKAGSRYTIESLKDVPIFRAYRAFFWNIGIDPTKVRPAAEALIRRTLRGKPIPTINTLVDSYNLASMETEVALAAFDADKVMGRMLMRTAEEGESFLGIGMREAVKLRGGEIVLSDRERLLAVYPYRDADESKVTGSSRNIILLVCGVPGVGDEALTRAGDVALEYITRFCGGDAVGEW